MSRPRGRPVNMENVFTPSFTKNPKTVNYDNARENIDPHIRTQAMTSKQGTIQHTPTNAKDIVNKEYADLQDNKHVLLDGETTNITNGTFDLTTTGTLGAGATTLSGTLNMQEYIIDNVGDIQHDDASASDWILRNQDLNKHLKLNVNDGGADKTGMYIDGATGRTHSMNSVHYVEGPGDIWTYFNQPGGTVVAFGYRDSTNAYVVGNPQGGWHDPLSINLTTDTISTTGFLHVGGLITSRDYSFTVKGSLGGIALQRTNAAEEPFILLLNSNDTYGGQIRGHRVTTDGFRFTNRANNITFLDMSATYMKLPNDNQPIIQGGGGDVSAYFDGSDWIFASNNITANDEIHFTNFDAYTFDNDITTTGRISSGTKTITSSADNTDVSGVNTVWVTTAGGDVVLGGLTGGVDGQVLYIVRKDTTNDLTLEHAEGAGDQDFIMHQGSDEIIDGGGVVLVCDGSDWYDCSHAKHV